jgi:hypothetical protein
MNSPVYDLQARRAAKPRDAGSVIDNLSDGAKVLLAAFESFPGVFLRESHIVGVERNLVELQRLLIELRQFVPATVES